MEIARRLIETGRRGTLRAKDEFEVSLVPYARSRSRQVLRYCIVGPLVLMGNVLMFALGGVLVNGVPMHRIIIRRKVGRQEFANGPAPVFQAERTLRYIQADLELLSVKEFEEKWGDTTRWVKNALEVR